MEPLLNKQEAATLIGVSPRTIEKYVSFRRIPFVRVGRLVKFNAKSLEAWLKRHESEERKDWR
ncbi:MAG: helix-turn-helix domain-containing protein [Vulcanimicrobiota bacterium]